MMENDLKSNIFNRARIFIEKRNEFAPFGAKWADGHIKDVMYDSGEEDIIDSTKAVEYMTEFFSKEILNGNAQATAIAYDVAANFKNADDIYEKRDALCLKLSTDGVKWKEEYFPYMVIDGNCVWG